jgi:hypothetical protein
MDGVLNRKVVGKLRKHADPEGPRATVSSLQITTGRALRLFQRVASDQAFARALGAANAAGHEQVRKLVQPLYTARIDVLGAGGFNIVFRRPNPTNEFSVLGHTINTREANAKDLTIIAGVVIPFYRAIVMSKAYAARVVRAVNSLDDVALTAIVREKTSSSRLISVNAERVQPSPEFDSGTGFRLVIRTTGMVRYDVSVT